MTDAEIKTKVNGVLNTLWTAIQNRQTTYLANNGKYWQGKWSHSLAPAEGNDVAPDRTNIDKPTDIAEKWTDLFTVPAVMPCSIKVDVYSGPLGIGYVGTVIVRILGETWTRSQNSGPETWRTDGWSKIS